MGPEMTMKDEVGLRLAILYSNSITLMLHWIAAKVKGRQLL
jgi:hypothetical protein